MTSIRIPGVVIKGPVNSTRFRDNKPDDLTEMAPEVESLVSSVDVAQYGPMKSATNKENVLIPQSGGLQMPHSGGPSPTATGKLIEQEEIPLSIDESEQKKNYRRNTLKLSKYSVQIDEATRLVRDLAQHTLSNMGAIPQNTLLSVTGNLDRMVDGKDDPHSVSNKSSTVLQLEPDRTLIGSIKQLSNYTKKLVNRKKFLENQIDVLKAEYLKAREDFESKIKDSHMIMDRLRQEKSDAVFEAKDLRFQYELKVKNLEQEAADAKRELEMIESMKESMEKTIDNQEEQLYAVPRLEEKYLRKARSIVVLKQKELNEKQMELRKLKMEGSNAEYWQQQCLLAREEARVCKEQLDVTRRENIVMLCRFQKQVTAEKERERKMTYYRQTHGEDAVGDDTDLLATINRSDKDSTIENKSSSNTNATCTKGSTAATTTTPNGHKKASYTSTNQPESPRKNQGLDLRMDPEFAAVELNRLKQVNEDLRAQIKELSRKLASARAYPLYNTRPTKDDEEESVGKLNHQEMINELFFPSDDEEDGGVIDWKTEEELILEKQAGEMAEQKRIERAIAFSDGYKEKLKQLRKSRPGSEHFKSLQKLQKKQQQV